MKLTSKILIIWLVFLLAFIPTSHTAFASDYYIIDGIGVKNNAFIEPCKSGDSTIQTSLTDSFFLIGDNSCGNENIFQSSDLKNGDVVHFDPGELIDNAKLIYKKAFFDHKELTEQAVPCIVKRGDEFRYGLCKYNILQKFQKYTESGIKIKNLLDYNKNEKNGTVVYVFLPKNRKNIGFLVIKHNGELIRNKYNKVLMFRISGVSRHLALSKQQSRIQPESNTPQGIYIINNVMLKKKDVPELGMKDYLNIDIPFYDLQKSCSDYNEVLHQLIPDSEIDKYWSHELILAKILGRKYFRIHSNSKNKKDFVQVKDGSINFNATKGCLNILEKSEELIELLQRLGGLKNTEDEKDTQVKSAKNHTILIVKDIESVKSLNFLKSI